MREYNYTCLERFLRYVKIDTQSDPNSESYPSTEKQKDLGRVLADELVQMGITDAHMDEFGYVYGTLPANTDKKVPVICFCSHMDTSPDSSGANVNPVVHKNYDGGTIAFAADDALALSPTDNPELADRKGDDIVTSDGKTLLGADDKAGVAEIMDAVQYLLKHPEVKHGTVKILFTPDEEVGRGVDKADIKKLGAEFAYTMDGGTRGLVEDETFSANSVDIIIRGVITHPGQAKNKMESAIKIAADIISALPKDSLSPETTEKREGFIHPVSVKGGAEKTSIHLILRDFEDHGISDKVEYLKEICERVIKDYKNSSYDFLIKESYRNMKRVLDKYPQVMEYAFEAVRRSGMEPWTNVVRGGTDGSRLSFMGLPCPNIFSGGHAIHSRKEWVSVQDMQKAVETIVNLVQIWEEKS